MGIGVQSATGLKPSPHGASSSRTDAPRQGLNVLQATGTHLGDSAPTGKPLCIFREFLEDTWQLPTGPFQAAPTFTDAVTRSLAAIGLNRSFVILVGL